MYELPWDKLLMGCAAPIAMGAASVLVGCFYGPLYPGLMAIASRRFVDAIDAVSSLMIISTDASTVIVPATMGLLIPALGSNWVMLKGL